VDLVLEVQLLYYHHEMNSLAAMLVSDLVLNDHPYVMPHLVTLNNDHVHVVVQLNVLAHDHQYGDMLRQPLIVVHKLNLAMNTMNHYPSNQSMVLVDKGHHPPWVMHTWHHLPDYHEEIHRIHTIRKEKKQILLKKTKKYKNFTN